MSHKQQKCIWTGKKSDELNIITLKTLDRFAMPTKNTFYVLPEYENNLREFNREFLTYGRAFLYSIIGLTLLLVVIPLTLAVLAFSNNLVLLSVGLMISIMGALMFFFPFATPETMQWLGICKAQIVTKWVGILTVIFGIIVYMFPNF